MKLQMKTFEEIKKEAIKRGVEPNNVSIGIWAKINGYVKTRKIEKGKVRYYYLK